MFLDKDSLLDGQSWLGGLVTGLVTSMTFVPLLSWTEDDRGSLGGLSTIQAGGFDRVSHLSLSHTHTLSLARPLPPSPSLACTLSLSRSLFVVDRSTTCFWS